jgi:hypothetical protein
VAIWVCGTYEGGKERKGAPCARHCRNWKLGFLAGNEEKLWPKGHQAREGVLGNSRDYLDKDERCKGSLASILSSYYVIYPTSIYPCRFQILYPFDFTPPLQFLPSYVQLAQARLFQYKGFRLYTDVTVRNKVEEESDLTNSNAGGKHERLAEWLSLKTQNIQILITKG